MLIFGILLLAFSTLNFMLYIWQDATKGGDAAKLEISNVQFVCGAVGIFITVLNLICYFAHNV